MDTPQKIIDRCKRQRDEVLRIFTALDDKTIEHLARAAQEPSEIDGYSPGGEGSEIHLSDVSDPTGNAAMARLTDFRVDPVMRSLDEIFTSLTESNSRANVLERNIAVVIHAGDKIKGRVSDLKQCQACHRDVACTVADPIRNGYCGACSTRWYEWKKDFAADDMPIARRYFEDQRTKFDGHQEPSCEMCAYIAELIKPAIAS